MGMARLSQLSMDSGREAQEKRILEILFWTRSYMERFKSSQVAAQVSAVAVTAELRRNVVYTEGVMVFTMQKGGLTCMRHQ
jgi:hypothetical protein